MSFWTAVTFDQIMSFSIPSGCVANIGGRESKEQLLDTVKSLIQIRGSFLCHTTTQRRRESISPENALKPRYLYLILLLNFGVRLRRRSLCSHAVLILTNHLKSLSTYLQHLFISSSSPIFQYHSGISPRSG